MTLSDYLWLAALIVEIAVIISALYFRSKGNVIETVSQLIALAEKTGMPGPDKMAMVVDEMYKRLPAPFRTILTKEKLQAIAQYIFDWTRQYALDYLASKQNSEDIPQDFPEAIPEDGGDDTFIEEYEFVPEICNTDECVEDACPIQTEAEKTEK